MATFAQLHTQYIKLSLEIHKYAQKYLPCNLGGFGESFAAMNFQLTFHIPLNPYVIVV